MAEKEMERKNSITYILIGLLVVASFAIGSLWTKVKTLEKGGVTTGTGNQTAQGPTSVSPTPLPVVVNDDDPFLGPKDAKVTAVVFADYQCPYCGAFSGYNQEIVKYMQDSAKKRGTTWEPTEINLIKDYVKTGKVKLVFKDYPFLDQSSDAKESHLAAEAAWCAGEQGKYWEFHDYLFSHQKGENEGTFSKDNLKKIAITVGLKASDFNTCFDGGKYQKKVDDAQVYGQGVGVNGTPALFVNGKMVPGGAIPYDQVKKVIDAELNK